MSLKRVNANHFDEKMEMRTGRRTIEKENIIAAVYSFLEIYLIACYLKILVKKSEKKTYVQIHCLHHFWSLYVYHV